MSNENSDLSEAEIAALVERARKSALLLNKTKFPDDPGEPGCWLGGEPTLPPEYDWPHHEVEGISSPLTFVAQIDLSRVPTSDEFPTLPGSGTLFFFYDPHFGTKDAKVIYVAEDVSMTTPRDVPDLPGPNRFMLNYLRKAASDAVPLKRWNFEFMSYASYSSYAPMDHALFLRIGKAHQAEIDAAGKAVAKRWSGLGRGSSTHFAGHFMFGCERELPPPGGAPALLLTMQSDADVGVVSSAHYLFWIPTDALEVLDFDRAFLTTE